MRVGFYAPMKPPNHPSPSGDRAVGQLLIEAMTLAGHQVQVMSEFRSLDISGDAEIQRNFEIKGREEAKRILGEISSNGLVIIDLWFTYHLFHKAPDWLGAEISKTLGIPYVVAEAAYAPKQQTGPWHAGLAQVETALRSADGVISLNPRDRHCIQPFLNANVTQSSLLPFTRQLPNRQEERGRLKARLGQHLGIDSRPPWLIAVAMMRKGDKERSFWVLASALVQILDLDWQLILIGSGDAADSVNRAFDPIGEERVHALGMLEPEETQQYLDASDVFVWPAVNEAFGMAMLEAHRHGLPVVAGYTDGTATIVKDQVTGFLTEPENIETFAQAVRHLLENHNLRETMERGAREKFLSDHTLEDAARALDSFLRSLTLS